MQDKLSNGKLNFMGVYVENFSSLLLIIRRQNAALKKAVEQRDDFFDPDGYLSPDETQSALNDFNKELTAIMENK